MIYGPPYSKIVSEMQQLAREFPESASLINYGTSAGGQPLYTLKIQRKNINVKAAPAILITGATHGYEYLNIEDRLPRWFLENQTSNTDLHLFFSSGGAVYIVPIFNPDGYEGILNTTIELLNYEPAERVSSNENPKKRYRWNANKIDLNRDYDLIPKGEKLLTQPETKSFTHFLDADLKKGDLILKFTMDYHCCGRFDSKDQAQLGYPWAYTRSSIPESDLKDHQRLAAQIKNIFNNENIVSGSWSEMLYEARGTATDYFYAKYGARSFVFEGLEEKEHLRFSEHTKMWSYLLRISL